MKGDAHERRDAYAALPAEGGVVFASMKGDAHERRDSATAWPHIDPSVRPR